jgi:hypothetical protein
MKAVHLQLTHTMGSMTGVMGSACGQPEIAVSELAKEQDRFDWAIGSIKVYLDRGNEGS